MDGIGPPPFSVASGQETFFDDSKIHYNFSNYTVHEIIAMSRMERYLSPTAETVFVVCYVLMILAGVIGNIMIGHVIWRKKTLRTPRNLYIINLTFSDLSMCIFCMPFTLVQLLNKDFNLGTSICKLIHVIQCTNIMVSISTIVAIAVDRYAAIVVGMSERSRGYVSGSLFIIWFISFAFTIPLFYWYKVEPVFFDKILMFRRCLLHWPSESVKYTYNICVLVMMYVIPITVLSMVHASIKNYLGGHLVDQYGRRQAQREIHRNKKTTMLLTALAVAFAVSWLPFQIVNILADFGYSEFEDPKTLYTVIGSCHLIYMSTACTNPILYGWLNTNLRRELREYLPLIAKKVKLGTSWSIDNTTKPDQEESHTRGGESVTYSTVVFKNSCSPRIQTRSYSQAATKGPPGDQPRRSIACLGEAEQILLTLRPKSPGSQSTRSGSVKSKASNVLLSWQKSNSSVGVNTTCESEVPDSNFKK